jgi:hypothetical protein
VAARSLEAEDIRLCSPFPIADAQFRKKGVSHAVDQRSMSLWMDVDVAPDARPLRGDQQCDVLVLGSGMAGISTAYELAATGQRVMSPIAVVSVAASPRAPAPICRRYATI